jgi:hypothetical protein
MGFAVRKNAMNSVPLWFERKFDFTFPVEQYPNLHVRLWGSPARLEEMLRGRSRDILIEKPAGKWSAQEHAGHLADLEPLWMARADDFLTDVDTLTAADLTNRKTDEANHNGRKLEEILTQFRTARLRLMERLAGVYWGRQEQVRMTLHMGEITPGVLYYPRWVICN